MRNRLIIIGSIAALLTGVIFVIYITTKPPAPTKTAVKSPHYASAIFMKQPTVLRKAETTAQLLPIWRKYREQNPTLLLLTNNPHLTPLPKENGEDVAQLLTRGIPEEIIQAGDLKQTNPLIRSESAVDIALSNQWFSRLAWALPLINPAQELDLDEFRAQLLATNAITETEAATLTLDERFFSAELRGQKMTAAALPLHQNITGPVVVHIDLSYFQPMYRNELTTPLLDLIFNTLSTLKKMHLKTLAVTFSYGHLDEQIALDVRFIGEILAYLIEDPTRMDQTIPINWQRQAEALYQANFSKNEKVRDLYLAQELDDPNSAWIKYNLYKSASAFNAGEQALNYLAQAVNFDRLYALEFLDLGRLAMQSKDTEEAMRMLLLAQKAFPNNAQIKQQLEQLSTIQTTEQ